MESTLGGLLPAEIMCHISRFSFDVWNSMSMVNSYYRSLLMEKKKKYINRLSYKVIDHDKIYRVMNDRLWGKVRLYFIYKEKTSLREESTYANGYKDLLEYQYALDGKLVSKTTYKWGKKNGQCSVYGLSETMPINIINYVNNKRDGEGIFYFSNGHLWKKVSYENDHLNGEFLEYHENGFVRTIGSYKDGHLEGPQTIFSETNGLPVKIENYKQGLLNGPSYDSATGTLEMGGIETKITYVDDIRHGPCYMKRNDVIIEKGYYKNGHRYGPYGKYDENGHLTEKGYYNEGKKHSLINNNGPSLKKQKFQ